MKKILTGCGLALFAGLAAGVELVIDIDGLKNSTGQVLVGLYNDPKSFPKKGKSLAHLVVPKLDSKGIRATFDNLPEGRYAVVVVHDEDMNHELTLYVQDSIVIFGAKLIAANSSINLS